ncbi:uncharacterized protein LOC113334537 [Papaver somniferum]|uniref:uncharacterized protein LOC113334537 n=1 Tax=Papaver somniferum TaxID=3469 RepID=UPI000E6F9D09|nr:uncharacterized protein LOC113334537 [Papaver somniferum]
MVQPSGYEDKDHHNCVCKLNNSLYGLKQAPRAWNEKLAYALISPDFKPSLAGPSLFVQKLGSKLTIMLVYVDDIIITNNDVSHCKKHILHLSTLFRVIDLGSLHFFLGLQVTRNAKGLFLCQTKYSIDLLLKCNLVGIKPCSSPCPANFKLSASDGDLLSSLTEYRSLVGSSQYLTWTRPDIIYAVNQICQFMHDPTIAHLQAAKRVLRYIKGTLGHGIVFSKGFSALQGYTDADWDGNPDDRRSVSGYCIFFGGNPISWSSKKQPTVSISSTEAEYKSLASTVA